MRAEIKKDRFRSVGEHIETKCVETLLIENEKNISLTAKCHYRTI
jgi:hypothetical protein